MNTANHARLTGTILLLIASIVWGFSFVTQSVGGQLLGPYAFNSSRMLLGSLVILLCTKTFSDRIGISRKPVKGPMTRKQILVGVVCGVLLAVATNLQQIALSAGVAAGKAGFITTFYIILVPVLGLFFHQKAKWNIWIAVLIALAGLFFLCINESFSLEATDLLLLGCAVAFACQILVIDHYGKDLDGLRLSGLQFLVCGILSAGLAVIYEILPYEGGLSAWLSLFRSGTLWLILLYLGIFSCGVGYTFQILGQQRLDPAVASILMSLESVFSLLSGWAFLGQVLQPREMLGCVLMFAAVILAQIRANSAKVPKNITKSKTNSQNSEE